MLLEALLLGGISGATGRSWMPRGLGWVAIPIAAGLAGAALGSRFRLRQVGVSLAQRPTLKLAVVGILVWIVMVVGYTMVADPFGGYWDSDEWASLWRWLLIPPVLAGVLLAVIAYAYRPKGPPMAGTPAQALRPAPAAPPADQMRETLEPLIARAKVLGATEPRQAFDITIGRKSAEEEWQRHRYNWELLWPYVPAFKPSSEGLPDGEQS